MERINVLVVDDNRLNRTLHCRMLEMIGIKNEFVIDGKEAIDVHSSGKKFDLILMDSDMPIMNGIQATKKLREMGIDCIIAGVTSRSMEIEKQEFIEAGLDDLHEKPLSIPIIQSIIQKFHLSK